MKKKTRERAFTKSILKNRREYDLSDSAMEEYITNANLLGKTRDYQKAVAKKYGKPVAIAVAKWWQDLTHLERAQTKADTAEEIYQAYLVNNPDKVSSKIIKKATKGKVHDHTLDELGPPEVGDDGKIRPGKKMVLKKTPPRQPSPQEISKMSVREIADLIRQTRDALWPGGGGGEDIPGLSGVGASEGSR